MTKPALLGTWMQLLATGRSQLGRAYAKLFARPCLVPVHHAMLRVAMRGLGILNYSDNALSGEAYFVDRVLPRFVTGGSPVFFDVGANRGDYSRLLARRFPGARIFAYEPHPVSFRLLADCSIPQVRAFELALGETPGQTVLFDVKDADGSSGASIHRGVVEDIWGKQAIAHDVPQDTLDRIAERLGIDQIDLLKIDTEGSELAVLLGASMLLQHGSIGLIQFEFNEMNVVSHAFLRDFRAILRDWRLWRLLPSGLAPISPIPALSELFAFQNVLAVPASRAHLL